MPDDIDRLADLFGLNQGPVTRPTNATFVSADSFADREVPPREWHVPDLIPAYTVTMLGGDGGTGKSLLSLQLAVATALGLPWIGREPRQGKVIYLSAEDDMDELHRRLADVVSAAGRPLSALGDLLLMPRAGEDATLAMLDRRTGRMVETGLFATLKARIEAEAPVLLVLDTLADLHSGDQNDQGHARQVISLFRGLAIQYRMAVLLLAHPSLTGINSGTGTSGSMAWNNSVRSRLYFSRITEDGQEADTDARTLVAKKANYGPVGLEIRLRWQDGVFVAENSPSGLDRMSASAKAERVFLKLLQAYTDEGRYVSHNPGPTYAPHQFSLHPGAERCTKRALTRAMEALFQKGTIRVGEHGSGAKARSHIEVAR